MSRRLFQEFGCWARRLRSEVQALSLVYRDPRTPWYAKLCLALVLGYALSPVDLIPDFIPILGHLDDLLLVPLGVWLALRLIPPHVLAEARARQGIAELPVLQEDALSGEIGARDRRVI